jgi:thiamine pyrophosphokinase
MNDVILFVHGAYRREHLSFYKKLCRAKIKAAVDGGFRFFSKARVIPDYVIGDMDSTVSLAKLLPRTTVITFPARKNKTDSQLAVEYFIEQGARKIDMVMPSVGQPDHFVANVLLPMLAGVSLWAKRGGSFRIINKQFEVRFLHDGEAAFSDCRGDTVSVIPLSRQITLTCTGTEYDVDGARVLRGHTRALRNQVASGNACITIRGEALVWHFFG